MVKGFSVPMSQNGEASMVPAPPWYYVGNTMEIVYLADPKKIQEYMPEGMNAAPNGLCVLNFIDWQTASVEFPEKYVQPEISQYHEVLLIVQAELDGETVGYCPFIWVDNDTAVLRGHVYGYPKQLGSIAMTKVFNVDSNAAPQLRKGAKLGASAAAKNTRLFDACIELEEEDPVQPSGDGPRMVTLRHFPSIQKSNGYKPAIKDLVSANRYDVKIANRWKGKATIKVYSDCYPDLEAFQPLKVLGGAYQVQSHTTDDMVVVKDLN